MSSRLTKKENESWKETQAVKQNKELMKEIRKGLKELRRKRNPVTLDKLFKPQVRAILFDLGNVLIHFDAVRAARRFAREADVPFEKVWRHFFTSRVEKAYTRGEITTREFFRHAKAAFNSHVDFPSFQKIWNDIFWENRGIRPLLRRLSCRYPLYLISNTNRLHFDHVKRRFPQIFRHFKKTFPSHVVGRRKPDPRIYWKVLKAIRLRPEETVFIDDMPRFVEAARKVGMKGVRYRSISQLKRELRKVGVQF